MIRGGFRSLVLGGIALSLALFIGAYGLPVAQAKKCGSSYKVTTVFVVRHADRANDHLSPAGEERARQLAEILVEAGVKGIYTSKFERTKQTAQCLSDCLNIPHEELPQAPNLESSLKKVLRSHAGQSVLIVNHHGGVKQIVDALGADGSQCACRGDEYDNLCVVTVYGRRKAKAVRLQYGVPSPGTGPRCPGCHK